MPMPPDVPQLRRPRRVYRGDEFLHITFRGEDGARYACDYHGRLDHPETVLRNGQRTLVCEYCLLASPDIPNAIEDGVRTVVGA